jgi:serine/threonine protein kinase
MADVFLCEHLVMRRLVAVKVLPSCSSDPVALERFRREARAVARLRHANIVGAHDIDKDGELHFLVMEYIEGSNLRTVINEQGRMDPLWAAHYIRQAALGLQHAHEAGLVHRDIKPSNLLLDRTGTIKILDLGLARFFDDDSDDLSVLGGPGPVGTSNYMAPEQAVNSHQVDIRADVYGLGATFYFLLAGRSPSRKGTLRQKGISHQLNRPSPIKEIRPEIPDGLAAVLDRMIAREPGERFQTAAEVAEALAPWTQSLPAPPTELPEREQVGAGTGHAEAVGASSSFLFAPASSPVPWPEVESETAPSRDADRPTRPPEAGAQVRAASASGAAMRPAVAALLPPTSAQLSGEAGEVSCPVPGPSPQHLREKAGKSSEPHSPKKSRLNRTMLAVAALLLVGSVAAGLALYKRDQPPTGADSSARLRLLVPAYIYPADAGLDQWGQIIDSPAAAATVAIINPDSGPGKVSDPNYARILERARRRGVTMIGYVSTMWAARPLHEVKGEVDRWVYLYPGIQGIFFDQQASSADDVGYYVALYEYARKARGLSLVVTNPGTVCAEDYLARPATDLVCLVELPKDLGAYRRLAWTERYPVERFAALLYDVGPPREMEGYLLEMRENRIGYCFITDAKLPNPWSRLPNYWEEEVRAVQQVKAP